MTLLAAHLSPHSKYLKNFSSAAATSAALFPKLRVAPGTDRRALRGPHLNSGSLSTYLIPGASSRLVRPVQLICRCYQGRERL